MNASQLQHAFANGVHAMATNLAIDTPEGTVRLGEVLNDFQREFFTAIDPALKRLAGHGGGGCQRFYEERPRGHSKSTDLAVVITWVLVACRRKINGIGAAADKDQAKLLRDSVENLVRCNPILGELLDVQAFKITNKHTGSTFEIISSDASSSYGLTPHLIVADELCHWAKPDLWHSLLSSAAKRSDCVVCCISNAGWKATEWWELREAIRVDPDWRFARLDGPVASWIDQKHLAEQKRLLPPKVFARLWLNQWADGAGDALEGSDIEAAFTLPGPLAKPERGWSYTAGLDVGLARDHTALAIVGRHVGYSEPVRRKKPVRSTTAAALVELGIWQEQEPPTEWKHFPGSGRLKLARLQVWKPSNGSRVDLQLVESAIRDYAKLFALHSVSFDPWQAEMLAQRLATAGIYCEACHFTAANLQTMATATLDAFRERQLSLYPDDQLNADLRSLRVVEKGYGYRLESPRSAGGGHGDTATALAIALRSARALRTQQNFADRQLVLWP